MQTRVRLQIARQPDDTTCGPTCLHAIYRYYGDSVTLARVVREVETLPKGGTLAVLLANHALRRGYRAQMYTYNLQAWDPTWFRGTVPVAAKLAAQFAHRGGERLEALTNGYLDFLRLGGQVAMPELTPGLLRRHLRDGKPVLCGLSATYLYQEPREVGAENRPDDVRGRPSGHFVVACGYERRRRRVLVADPLHPNPPYDSRQYWVSIDRLVGAILLGILTYDANVLVLEPVARKQGARSRRVAGARGGRRAVAGHS